MGGVHGDRVPQPLGGGGLPGELLGEIALFFLADAVGVQLVSFRALLGFVGGAEGFCASLGVGDLL